MMTGRLLRWSVCSTIFSRRVCMRLYGIYNLHFRFTKKDVEQILNEIPGYSDQEKERVRDILFEQMRKYKYLFKN